MKNINYKISYVKYSIFSINFFIFQNFQIMIKSKNNKFYEFYFFINTKIEDAIFEK